MPLTIEESIKNAQNGLKLFDKNWEEVSNPESRTAIMANEKGYNSLVKREVYAKGLSVLRDLSKNHFTREKPGFFARLFRTKAAREYKAEREEMNRIAQRLEDIKRKEGDIPFTDAEKANKTCVGLTDVSVSYMISNREGMEFSDKELDTEMTRNRESFENHLNVKDPAAQDSKDQIICYFLNDLDKDFSAASPEVPVNAPVETAPEVKEDPELAEKLDKDVNKEVSAENEENVLGDDDPKLGKEL